MTNETQPNEPALEEMRRAIDARFAAFGKRLRFRMLLAGAAWVLGAALVLCAFGLLVDWRFELSRTAREIYVLAATLLTLGYGWWHLWRPGQMPWTTLDLAETVDRAGHVSPAQALAPRVASLMQLDRPSGQSEELSRAAVRSSCRFLKSVDLDAGFDGDRFQRSIAATLGLLLIPLLFVKAAPEHARVGYLRFVMGQDDSWPRNTVLRVVDVGGDGRLVVPRGEAFTLRAEVADKSGETDRVELRLEHASGRREVLPLTRFAAGDFRIDMAPLQAEARANLRGGDGRFGPFGIHPVDRPRVVDLTLVHQHPRSSAPAQHRFDRADGNLRLLKDTRVDLEWRANVPVSEVRLDSETEPPGEVQRTGPQSFRLGWVHEDAVQFRIALVSEAGRLVSHPAPVAVGLKEDRPPSVRLTHSGVRQRVSPTATIPLRLNARDDYGIASVEVNSRIEPALMEASIPPSGSGAGQATNRVMLYGPVSPAEEGHVEADHKLQLTPWKLQPGDSLRVNGSAADDRFEGAQQSLSQAIAFRVVAPGELFKEILLRQQQLRARLRQAADRARDLETELRAALLPEEGAALLRDHRLIQREVWQVHHALEETVTEMSLNNLGGEEAIGLIRRQVLEPLRSLHDLSLTRQRQGFESQAGAEPESHEALTARQLAILDEFERVLKNMSQWDSFIDVVNQLNTILKIEREVHRETRELKELRIESIFQK